MKNILVVLLLVVITGVANAGWIGIPGGYATTITVETTTETFYRSFDVYISDALINDTTPRPDGVPVIVFFHAEKVNSVKRTIEETGLIEYLNQYDHDAYMIINLEGIPINRVLNPTDPPIYEWGYIPPLSGGTRIMDLSTHQGYISWVVQVANYHITNVDSEVELSIDTDNIFGIGVNCGAYIMHYIALENDGTQNTLIDFKSIASVNTWSDERLVNAADASTVDIPVFMFQDVDYFVATEEVWTSDPDDYATLRRKNKHHSRARKLAAEWGTTVNGHTRYENIDMADAFGCVLAQEYWPDPTNPPNPYNPVRFVTTWSGQPLIVDDPSDPAWPTQYTAHELQLNMVILRWFGENYTPIDYTETAGSSPEEVTTVGLPETMVVGAVYPNPFNDAASFSITLSDANHVRVQLVNILGQRVLTVHDGWLDVGAHQFTIDAHNLASGVYFLEATSDQGAHDLRKIMLLR